MKPRVKEVIVVEGRYDRNALLQAVDATVVETGGFSVFNDREKLAFLRRLAEKRGLILLTDPDGAGFVIRNHLKGAIPRQQLKQAYVPDIAGKERRKRHPGKEGKLGVEGMRPEVLLEALRRCGATLEGEDAPAPGGDLTKADMMDKGLVGPDSSSRIGASIRQGPHQVAQKSTSTVPLSCRTSRSNSLSFTCKIAICSASSFGIVVL